MDILKMLMSHRPQSTASVDGLETEKPCDLAVCKAECCYFPPLPLAFIDKYRKDTARRMYRAEVFIEDFAENDTILYVFTHPSSLKASDNPCPFLTDEFTCKHYDDRPSSCRTFGTNISKMCQCGFHLGLGRNNTLFCEASDKTSPEFIEEFSKLMKYNPCDYKHRYKRKEPNLDEIGYKK